MRAIIDMGVGCASGASTSGAQRILGRASRPERVELREIEPRNRRIVEVGDAVPGIGAQPVDDGSIIGDQIRSTSSRRGAAVRGGIALRGGCILRATARGGA